MVLNAHPEIELETRSKLLSPEALCIAENAPQVVWWPGFAWTRYRGAYSAPQTPYIARLRNGAREWGKKKEGMV